MLVRLEEEFRNEETSILSSGEQIYLLNAL